VESRCILNKENNWQRVAGILKRYLNQTKSNNSILIAISELAEQRLQPAESTNIESLKAAKAALETHIYVETFRTISSDFDNRESVGLLPAFDNSGAT
jgi:hypothetical protein